MILDIEVVDAARVAEQLVEPREDGSPLSPECALLSAHLKRAVEGANALLGINYYVGTCIRIQVNICGERVRHHA